DEEKKVVEEGALWTEEYLPLGTVMLGAVFDGGRKNSACNALGVDGDGALGKLGELLNGSIVTVGGKETIGRGLLRFVTYS
ncbi:MAG: hypothetical protein ACP5ID_06775, partial [Conexivisphaera sp.]